MKEYVTIKAPCERELIIKKSRFIGRLYPVCSMEEAQEKLAEVKKLYWDATHNCSAIIVGESGEYTRSSDDGEPQGTAGIPMLEALKHSGLKNVLCVVTRYFGGILLGAGGLVRAYTQSVSEVCAAAEKFSYIPYLNYSVTLPFNLWGKMQASLLKNGFLIDDVSYLSEVTASVLVLCGEEQRFIKLISELSAGKISPVFLGEKTVEKKL